MNHKSKHVMKDCWEWPGRSEKEWHGSSINGNHCCGNKNGAEILRSRWARERISELENTCQNYPKDNAEKKMAI